MEGLDLLRSLAAHVDSNAEDGSMPPSALRFIIEYPEAIDMEAEMAMFGQLIGTEQFNLRPVFDDEDAEEDAEFGEFYVLQVGGLERTMSQPQLFSIAHELQAELGVLTVEPDLGATVYQEPVAPGAEIEAAQVGEAFGSLCFVDDGPPSNERWALESMNVPGAWAMSPDQGAGILIAQPDTGITDHPEFEPGSISPLQYSVFSGQNDATDPFQRGNKGHGTGTGSVAVSRGTNRVAGSAPGAQLVPIRCIESVVITFNAGPVVEAINYARQRGCHIVTMSLGGTPSRAVKKAIKKAIAADMIVLAAAGNCVRIVVWPARYGDVIAVAGSNIRDEVWRGSCRGSDVDITAPGENVWKAASDPDTGNTDVTGGQGTSFATALTAGAGALWLAHWGRETVIASARSKGTTVQELFREALTATARVPAGWDTNNLGAGIVDAEKLLKHPIDELRPKTPATAKAEGANLVKEVLGGDVANRLSSTSPQFDLEVSALLLNDARRGIEPGTAAGVETSAGRLPASTQLVAALDADLLEALGERPTHTPINGPIVVEGAVDAPDPAVLLAPSSVNQLESVTAESTATARIALEDARDERLALLGQWFGPDRGDLTGAAGGLLDAITRGDEVPADKLSRTGLEALIALDGSRPAIALRRTSVADQVEEFGQWADRIQLLSDIIDQRQKSVGRIDAIPGTHTGTGFVIGDGLVLTNRHVIESLAIPTPTMTSPASWILPGEPTINFSVDGVDPDHAFLIEEVVFSGDKPIGTGVVDMAKLDVALLRVCTTNKAATPFPDALPVTDKPPISKGRRMFVVGYPAMPVVLPKDQNGQTRRDVVQELRRIFGGSYGQKHLSPGLVLEGARALADSPNQWTFTHDATSLGGNSGSCVLSADDEVSVVGLHFAGNWLRANFAHDIAIIHDLIRGLQ